jgi:hypothetical protein
VLPPGDARRAELRGPAGEPGRRRQAATDPRRPARGAGPPPGQGAAAGGPGRAGHGRGRRAGDRRRRRPGRGRGRGPRRERGTPPREAAAAAAAAWPSTGARAAGRGRVAARRRAGGWRELVAGGLAGRPAFARGDARARELVAVGAGRRRPTMPRDGVSGPVRAGARSGGDAACGAS